MPIRAVCFDVGETLIDETRHWSEWAEFLGVPKLTLFTALGVTMERGQSLRRVFEIFRPDLDFSKVRQMRAVQGYRYDFHATDLYPDVVPCLAVLKSRGLKVLIAGNQPIEAEAALARLHIPADLIATSGGWGVSKPDPAFFERVIDAAGEPAESIAYVGDRMDNDVLPARAAGMVAVLLRRGPWGWMHAERPDVDVAHLVLHDLAALPDALAAL
jgi:HAD superfamily hydrolase (TIGR01549 family)